MTELLAGIHKISLPDYIADPAPVPSLNSGTAHRLIESSPSHAWMQHPRLNPAYESDASSRLDLGTIAHALLLEADASKVVVIQADDWRTKAAKEERDAARTAGLYPILAKDHEAVEAMVSAAHRAIGNSEFAQDFAEAVPEQTLIWEQQGVWHRARPDKATTDWRILFDYKTVAGSAHPHHFMRRIVQHGYDLQAELGMQGVEHLCKQAPSAFVFIAQEIEPPYAVSFVSLAPAWYALAKRKLDMARTIWKGCLRTNEWPSYSTQVAYVEPPGYAEIGWDDYLTAIDAEDL